MNKQLAGIILMICCSTVYARDDSPYQGQQNREIKSLSTDDIGAYLEGKGMGLAKAAELNHYPGPRHVLDLSDKLALTEMQKKETQALFASMQAKAMAVGKQIIDHESLLDSLFRNGDINTQRLDSVLQQIGRLQTQLRFIHLNTHLAQKAILTAQQIERYDRLRGYGRGGHHNATNRHQH